MSSYVSSLLKRREISLVEALACVGGGFVSFGVYKLVQRYARWVWNPLHKLPGPRGGFLFGVYPQIQKEPFMTPHKRWLAEAGPATKMIHYTTLFGRSNLLILDKEIIKQILTAPAGKKNHRYTKRLLIIQNIAGDGLVTLDGPDWLRHRRIIQPAFSTGLLREALQATVPDKVNELIAYWKKAGNREIDAHSHFSALTLDIIGPVAFSHEFHGLDAIRTWAESTQDQVPELNDPFLAAIFKGFKIDFLTALLIAFDRPSWDRMRSKKRLAREFLNAETDKIVAAARTGSDKPKTKSVLSALLEAQDSETEGSLTLEELRDEVKTCT